MELGKLYRFSEYGIYRRQHVAKALGGEASIVWVERTDGSVMTTDIYSLYVVVLEINSFPNQPKVKKAKVLLPDASIGFVPAIEDEWELVSPAIV
jgi:hypothetical protein